MALSSQFITRVLYTAGTRLVYEAIDEGTVQDYATLINVGTLPGAKGDGTDRIAIDKIAFGISPGKEARLYWEYSNGDHKLFFIMVTSFMIEYDLSFSSPLKCPPDPLSTGNVLISTIGFNLATGAYQIILDTRKIAGFNFNQ